MAYTTADLTALQAAIAASELEVEYDGSRVRFRSMKDLLDAAAYVETKLASQTAGSSGGRTGPWRFNMTTSRGD